MNRRVGIAIAVVGIAVALAAAALWLSRRESGPAGPGEPGAEESVSRPVPFDLYFPGEGGYLFPEERELAVTGETRVQARAIVLALLDGPRDGTLIRPFPEGVGLHDLYLTPDGTVYVDLGAEGQDHPPAGGSLAEMMMVYSVVDSLAFNLPAVERVALLWNGVQRETFSGHLDTSVALRPQEDLVAAAARDRRPPA